MKEKKLKLKGRRKTCLYKLKGRRKTYPYERKLPPLKRLTGLKTLTTFLKRLLQSWFLSLRANRSNLMLSDRIKASAFHFTLFVLCTLYIFTVNSYSLTVWDVQPGTDVSATADGHTTADQYYANWDSSFLGYHNTLNRFTCHFDTTGCGSAIGLYDVPSGGSALTSGTISCNGTFGVGAFLMAPPSLATKRYYCDVAGVRSDGFLTRAYIYDVDPASDLSTTITPTDANSTWHSEIDANPYTMRAGCDTEIVAQTGDQFAVGTSQGGSDKVAWTTISANGSWAIAWNGGMAGGSFYCNYKRSSTTWSSDGFSVAQGSVHDVDPTVNLTTVYSADSTTPDTEAEYDNNFSNYYNRFSCVLPYKGTGGSIAIGTTQGGAEISGWIGPIVENGGVSNSAYTLVGNTNQYCNFKESSGGIIFSNGFKTEGTAPTTTDNWTDNWTSGGTVSVTLSPTDGGSGMSGGSAGTWYCIDTTNTCSPATLGTGVTVTCAASSVCTQYIRYYSKDALGNANAVQSKRVRQDREVPAATTDNWTDNVTNTSPITVTLTRSDGSGSGIAWTKYCVDGTNTCDPTTGTSGTSVSVTCVAGSECLQYVRYRSQDNVSNLEASTKSETVRIDRKGPTGTSIAINDIDTLCANYDGSCPLSSGACGANQTDVLNTSLTLAASDAFSGGVSQMEIANDSSSGACTGLTDTTSYTYTTSVSSWNLTSGLGGNRYNCARFKDNQQNWTAWISDTTLYRPACGAPSVRILSPTDDSTPDVQWDVQWAGHPQIGTAASNFDVEMCLCTGNAAVSSWAGFPATACPGSTACLVSRDDDSDAFTITELEFQDKFKMNFNTALSKFGRYYARVQSKDAVLSDSGYTFADFQFGVPVSPLSAESVDAAPPATPTIRLRWTDANSAEDGCTLHRKPEGGSWATISASLPCTPATYDDTSAAPGAYYYRMAPYKTASYYADWSNEAYAKTNMTWQVDIKCQSITGVSSPTCNVGSTYRTYQGTGNSISQVWDGLGNTTDPVNGPFTTTAPNGVYQVIYDAHSEYATNSTQTLDNSLKIDRATPTVAIASPAASAWASSALTPTIQYTDSWAELSNGECKYRVLSNGTETLTWTSAGSCSGTSTVSLIPSITVGSSASCRDQGTDKCTVEVTATDISGNWSATGTRNFSIDWSTPTVSLTSPASTSWKTANFSISASDTDTGGSGLATCQYQVESYNGSWVVRRSWTTRTCDSVSSAQITVGSGQDCQDEGTGPGGNGICRVSIKTFDTAANVSAIASSTYKIDWTAPLIAVTSPNTLVYWVGGSSHNITWTSTEANKDTVKIEYTTNGGGSYTTIDATDPDDGTYSWTLDVIDNNTVKVKITAYDQAGNYASDSSNVDFVIDSTNPQITVTSPNALVYWAGASSKNITWTTTETNKGTVKIEYSTDSGVNFALITASDTDDGAYAWTVPSINSSTVRVRIVSYDLAGNSATDTSDTDFVIDSTNPQITVTAPNTLVYWSGESSQNITWTTTETYKDTVKIEYTTDGGASYTAIAPSDTDDGTYAWVIPTIDNSTVRVRVTAYDLAGNSTADSSNVDFVIDSTDPLISVTQPNTLVYWSGGSSKNITWTTTETNKDTVKIEYTINGGASYTTIIASDPDDGTYAWTVPSIDNSTVRVKVTVYDKVGRIASDTSDVNFVIDSTNPLVSVTQPNTLVYWSGGSSKNITWTTTETNKDTVKIEYTINGGATYATIIATDPDDGTYAWTVPSIDNSTVRVKVTVYDKVGRTASDTSNVDFVIDSTNPVVSVTQPNTLVYWNGGSSKNITWTTTETNKDTVKIEYTTDGGASYTTIIASDTDDGTYAWTVPSIDNSTVKVRVTVYDKVGRTVSDLSDVNFVIDSTNPTVRVDIPNGGEIWCGTGQQNITWTSTETNKDTVTLEYTINNGGSYTTIAASTTDDGVYAWTLPAISTNTVKVRITVYDKVVRTVQDLSDNYFTIDNTTPDIVAIRAWNQNTYTTEIASNTWQNDGTVSFNWTDPNSPSDDLFYYEYNTISTDSIGGAESTTTNPYVNDYALTEGTYYFHVKPKTNASCGTSWGTERIFAIKYDGTTPTISSVTVTSSNENYFYGTDDGVSCDVNAYPSSSCTAWHNSVSGEGAGQNITVNVTWTDALAGTWKLQGDTAFGDTLSADTSSAGGWTQAYSVEASAGNYAGINFTVYDNAGNTDIIKIDFSVDNTKPAITIGALSSSQGSANWYIQTASTSYWFSDNDSATHTITLDGTINNTGSGNRNVTYNTQFVDTPSTTNSPSTTWSAISPQYAIAANGSDTSIDTDGTNYPITVTGTDNTGNATSVTANFYIDNTNPSTTDNWTDNWTSAQTVTVTLSPSDGSGSGLQWTKYCIDFANTCDPTTGTSALSASVSCASGAVCTQYVRYASRDKVTNTETTQSKRVRQDREAPTTPTVAADYWESGYGIVLTYSSTDGSGSGLPLTGTAYDIDRTTYSGGCGAYADLTTTASSTTLSGQPSPAYYNSGLTEGTSYCWRIRAVDAAGNWSDFGEVSNITMTDATSPGVPTGLTPTAISTTQIDLSWTAPSGSPSDYNIYQNTDSANLGGISTFADSSAVGGSTGGSGCTGDMKTDLSTDNACYVSAGPIGYTWTTARQIGRINTRYYDTDARIYYNSLIQTYNGSTWTTRSMKQNWANRAYQEYELAGAGGAILGVRISFTGGSTANTGQHFKWMEVWPAWIATSTATSYSNTALTANTQYFYKVDACDTTGNCSNSSATASKYTLPVAANITCARTPACNQWGNVANFDFTNAAGWGGGALDHYHYKWNQTAVDTAGAGDTSWTSATLSKTATVDGLWYLHVLTHNPEDASGGTTTYGPYYYDSTAPTTTDNWTDNWTSAQTVTVTLSPNDGSGSGIQWTKYCVDTANNCAPTTGTSGTSVVVTCASGTVCTQYVRYASKDNANNTETTRSKTVRQDIQNPTTTDDWTDNWTSAQTVTVTLSPTDGTGSGLQWTKYCVDTANTCDPTAGTSGLSVSVTCASGSVCTQYVRYASRDNVNNTETTNSKRVRQDSQLPATTDNWTDNWTAAQTVTVTLTPTDNSGSGLQWTKYCIDTLNTCDPASGTSGTSVSVTCAVGSVCTQYVRYASRDNVNNTETTNSKRVRQDLQNPTAGTVTPANVSYNGTHVDGTFDMSATFNDGSGSGVSSCDYCKSTDGTCDAEWASGTFNAGTCSTTGITCTNGQSLTLNMRGRDTVGNTGAGTAVSRTCDAAAPTTTDNWTDNWTIAQTVTVTLSPTDALSGVQSTYYCLDTANTCNPSTSGATATVTCAAASVCIQYVRYYSMDNVNNSETVNSKRVRQDRQSSSIAGALISEVTDVGNNLWVPASGDKLYYNTGATGTYKISGSANDGSGSGVATATYNTVLGDTPGADSDGTNWDSSVPGPAYGITIDDNSNASAVVTIYDVVGNIATAGFSIIRNNALSITYLTVNSTQATFRIYYPDGTTQLTTGVGSNWIKIYNSVLANVTSSFSVGTPVYAGGVWTVSYPPSVCDSATDTYRLGILCNGSNSCESNANGFITTLAEEKSTDGDLGAGGTFQLPLGADYLVVRARDGQLRIGDTEDVGVKVYDICDQQITSGPGATASVTLTLSQAANSGKDITTTTLTSYSPSDLSGTGDTAITGNLVNGAATITIRITSSATEAIKISPSMSGACDGITRCIGGTDQPDYVQYIAYIATYVQSIATSPTYQTPATGTFYKGTNLYPVWAKDGNFKAKVSIYMTCGEPQNSTQRDFWNLYMEKQDGSCMRLTKDDVGLKFRLMSNITWAPSNQTVPKVIVSVKVSGYSGVGGELFWITATGTEATWEGTDANSSFTSLRPAHEITYTNGLDNLGWLDPDWSSHQCSNGYGDKLMTVRETDNGDGTYDYDLVYFSGSKDSNEVYRLKNATSPYQTDFSTINLITNLTNTNLRPIKPTWSPDCSQIAFLVYDASVSTTNIRTSVYMINLTQNGSGWSQVTLPVTDLTQTGVYKVYDYNLASAPAFFPTWLVTSDGKYMVGYSRDTGGAMNYAKLTNNDIVGAFLSGGVDFDMYIGDVSSPPDSNGAIAQMESGISQGANEFSPNQCTVYNGSSVTTCPGAPNDFRFDYVYQDGNGTSIGTLKLSDSSTITTTDGGILFQNGIITAMFPAGSVASDTVIYNTDPTTWCASNGNCPAVSGNMLVVAGDAREFYPNGANFAKDVKLVFHYCDVDNNGKVDTGREGNYYSNAIGCGSSSGGTIDENKLAVYYWCDFTACSPQSSWIKLSGLVDSVNNTITVYTNHFSRYDTLGVRYGLAPGSITPLYLTNIHTYPNPYVAGPGSAGIIFNADDAGGQAQINVRIKIYDIRGSLVTTVFGQLNKLGNETSDYTKDANSGYKLATWDARNSGGSEVASGVYLYFLEAEDMTNHTIVTHKGKLTVIH